MSTPTTIPFTSIIFGSRARTVYPGIEELADDMRLKGNLVAIGLRELGDGTYLLIHGGRRYSAMKLLGITELHFGMVGIPGYGAYTLVPVENNGADDLMAELTENLHRHDLDWRDQMSLLVRGYRHEKRKANLQGEDLYMSTYGSMVGLPKCDINAAVQIHDDVVAHPETYKDCTSIQHAYQKVFLANLRSVEALMAKAVTTPKPAADILDSLFVGDTPSPGQPEPVLIDLSSRFRLGNSIDWLEHHSRQLDRSLFDHIICDPDFAVSKERLEAGTSNAAEGVAQDSVEDSLADLQRLIRCAFHSVRSYFVFFYDLDHHEKLQQWCTDAGFAVQRWPILWHKTDYGSNAAPQHNFTKNMEYAMVCRKPGSVLATAAPKGVISLPSGNTTSTFGHPFAKPIDLWLKIFSAVCKHGETVFDPFMGSGSSTVAAIRFGLSPSGMELQPQHFNRAILNIQDAYKTKLPHCTFA
jgi:site-specific DNA-methyltransferase (adenine-specific)